jgi:hypothetical protein
MAAARRLRLLGMPWCKLGLLPCEAGMAPAWVPPLSAASVHVDLPNLPLLAATPRQSPYTRNRCGATPSDEQQSRCVEHQRLATTDARQRHLLPSNRAVHRHHLPSATRAMHRHHLPSAMDAKQRRHCRAAEPASPPLAFSNGCGATVLLPSSRGVASPPLALQQWMRSNGPPAKRQSLASPPLAFSNE